MAKYDVLASYLRSVSKDRLVLTFEELENIVPLPRTAYWYKEFWTNYPGHSQAKAWLGAGWRVESLEPRRRVVFVRNEAPEE